MTPVLHANQCLNQACEDVNSWARGTGISLNSMNQQYKIDLTIKKALNKYMYMYITCSKFKQELT